MRTFLTFFFAFFLLFTSNAIAKNNDNCKGSLYSKQMKKYAEKVNPNMETLYCGCKFKVNDCEYMLDARSCGYNGNEDISVEHIVPKDVLKSNLNCGTVNNCYKTDEGAKRFNDIHNLMHSINTLNNHRNNYSHDIIKGEKREYGSCDFEILKLKGKCNGNNDIECKIVEPREDVRGFIARTYLYMQKKYNLSYKEREQIIMDAWNKLYPVEEWECIRDRNIAELQGDHNTFISEKCKNIK